MATLSVRAPAAVQLVRPFGYGRVRESTVNAANAIEKTKRRLLKLYVIEFPPVRCRILRSLLPPVRKGTAYQSDYRRGFSGFIFGGNCQLN